MSSLLSLLPQIARSRQAFTTVSWVCLRVWSFTFRSGRRRGAGGVVAGFDWAAFEGGRLAFILDVTRYETLMVAGP